MPTYYLSHGGGPWPWMPEMAPAMQMLTRSLQGIPQQLPQVPQAILMVTAHWEEFHVTVSGSTQPGMVYDYGGFPAHTYEVVYPAPGAVDRIERVKTLLESAGQSLAIDPTRGYDHGSFVPLAVMYPQAQVPVLQMSLKRGLNPAEHLAIGRSLAPLRDEGVLIVASGLSFHNLRAFGPPAKQVSKVFDDWLQATLAASPAERSAQLLQWESAPAARQCHPREEHLIPLMVAVGAAEQGDATCIYHEEDFFGGITASSFRFQ
nr:class III extradiol ring-cleavage dioxygenase [Curvibacter sp. CHRR-16]